MEVKKGSLDDKAQKHFDEAERFIVKIFDEKSNIIDTTDSKMVLLIGAEDKGIKAMVLGQDVDIIDQAKLCICARHLAQFIEDENPQIKVLSKFMTKQS